MLSRSVIHFIFFPFLPLLSFPSARMRNHTRKSKHKKRRKTFFFLFRNLLRVKSRRKKKKKDRKIRKKKKKKKTKQRINRFFLRMNVPNIVSRGDYRSVIRSKSRSGPGIGARFSFPCQTLCYTLNNISINF